MVCRTSSEKNKKCVLLVVNQLPVSACSEIKFRSTTQCCGFIQHFYFLAPSQITNCFFSHGRADWFSHHQSIVCLSPTLSLWRIVSHWPFLVLSVWVQPGGPTPQNSSITEWWGRSVWWREVMEVEAAGSQWSGIIKKKRLSECGSAENRSALWITCWDSAEIINGCVNKKSFDGLTACFHGTKVTKKIRCDWVKVWR